MECGMLHYLHQIVWLSIRHCVNLREMLANSGSHPEILGDTKNKLENI